MIKGLDINSFKKLNFIWFDNIKYGFENFSHICFTSDFYNFKKYIYHVINITEGDKFFDFYFANLDKTSKNTVLDYFIKNNFNLYKKIQFNEGEIYYNISDFNEELDFILKISFEEVLFSTFYFNKPQITIWTNYDKKFILFTKEDLSTHEEIAKKYNLEILFKSKK